MGPVEPPTSAFQLLLPIKKKVIIVIIYSEKIRPTLGGGGKEERGGMLDGHINIVRALRIPLLYLYDQHCNESLKIIPLLWTEKADTMIVWDF